MEIANANAALNGMTFTPASNFNGSATFNVSANDGANTTALGAKTISVSAVNDAPVASGTATLASVNEDVGDSAPGATVSTLFSGNFSDTTDSVSGGSSANTLAGVAIVDNAVGTGQGVWQYR